MRYLKAIIRWWDDEDNRGIVVASIMFGLFSAFVGASTSFWYGIFAIPLLYIAVIAIATPLCLAGIAVYFISKGASAAWERIDEWAYTEDSHNPRR